MDVLLVRRPRHVSGVPNSSGSEDSKATLDRVIPSELGSAVERPRVNLKVPFDLEVHYINASEYPNYNFMSYQVVTKVMDDYYFHSGFGIRSSTSSEMMFQCLLGHEYTSRSRHFIVGFDFLSIIYITKF